MICRQVWSDTIRRMQSYLVGRDSIHLRSRHRDRGGTRIAEPISGSRGLDNPREPDCGLFDWLDCSLCVCVPAIGIENYDMPVLHSTDITSAIRRPTGHQSTQSPSHFVTNQAVQTTRTESRFVDPDGVPREPNPDSSIPMGFPVWPDNDPPPRQEFRFPVWPGSLRGPRPSPLLRLVGSP